MNKLVDEIREALKPHHVEGFAAMCFPMPTLQQMEQLMAEVERLTADKQFLHQRRGELVIERDKARSEVNGNVFPLVWTSEKPLAQGYYWLRAKGCDGKGYEVVKIAADPATRQLYVQEHGDKHRYKLAEYGGPCEWYGPITLPA